jgi:hypothetical protein
VKKPAVLLKGALIVSMIAGVLAPTFMASPAAAAPATCTGNEDSTWTGAADTDWTNTSNWTGGAMPGPNNSVCIQGGASFFPEISTQVEVGSITGEDLVILFVVASGELQINFDSHIAQLGIEGNGIVRTVEGLTIDKELTLDDTAKIEGAGTLVTEGTSTSVGFQGASGVTVDVDWTTHSSIRWYDGDLTVPNLTIASDGLFQVEPGFANDSFTGTLLTIDGGAYLLGVDIDSDVALTGALITDGIINGDVNQTDGQLALGYLGSNPIETLVISGNYDHSGGSLDINATGPGVAGTDFDEVFVAGAYAISADASLTLHLEAPYEGVLNDSFAVVSGPSSGDYDEVSSADLATGLVASAQVSSGGVSVKIIAAPASIDGRVYFDENGDGTVSNDEHQGVDDVTVYDDVNNNGVLDNGEASTQTISSGQYILGLLPAGTHHVRAVVPANHKLTTVAPLDVVLSGADVNPAAIGFYEYNDVTGTIFNDDNGNGVKSAEETGISGVAVYVDANDNGVKDNGEISTTSANDGTYALGGMTKAHNPVRVRAVPPTGLLLSSGNPADITFSSSGNGYFDVNLGFNLTGPVEEVPDGPQFGSAPQDPASQGTGYWLIGVDGTIYSYGEATNLGSPASLPLNAPIVGMTASPQGDGYWAVGADGGIFAYGSAGFHGSTGGMKLNQPVVGMASTPSGEGYWVVAKDGGVFAYGDAKFAGSTGGMKINKPVVNMVATPSGEGYWLVASDGGVFAFGDAKFYGSLGGKPLNAPIVGIAATATGEGYWLVASDGGVFAYGDAKFLGGMGGKPLNSPIVSIKTIADGSGYWLIGADGGVFAFGEAEFLGTPKAPKTPIAQ